MQRPPFPGTQLQNPIGQKPLVGQADSSSGAATASNGPAAFTAGPAVGTGLQGVPSFPPSPLPPGGPALMPHLANGLATRPARPPFGVAVPAPSGPPPAGLGGPPPTSTGGHPWTHSTVPTGIAGFPTGPQPPRQQPPLAPFSAGSRPPPLMQTGPPGLRPSGPPMFNQRGAGAPMTRPPPPFGGHPSGPPSHPFPAAPLPSHGAHVTAQGVPPPPFAAHAAHPSVAALSLAPATSVPPPPSFGRAPSATPSPVLQPGSSPTAQPALPSSSSSKIDPARIPRPDAVDEVMDTFETRQSNAHAIPPPSTARYVVRDTGDCSPRYMRITLNNLPTTADMCKQTGLSLALAIQPLAVPEPGDELIQVVDFGESGPVRCKSDTCRAYINPFFKWIDGGQKFQCNFCGSVSPCPPDYFCPMGIDGRRRDADDRPELSKGSVEFVATQPYMVRPPMAPTHFFLIDVSYNAVQSGAVSAVCSSLVNLLNELQGGERVRIAIATFDSTIHFYGLGGGGGSPQMLVVPDVTELYFPAEVGLVVPLSEAREKVEEVLHNIPKLFAGNKVTDTAGGAAIKAAIEVLKRGLGGQVHAFISSLPKLGLLPLTMRVVQAGEKDALESLQPSSKDWKKLAEEAAEFQVCVDLFVLAQSYVDIASLSTLSAGTGGQVYSYNKFNSAQDGAQLYNDMRWNLVRPQGLEAIARLRCSKGFSVSSYTGSCYQRTSTDVEFPVCSSDNTLVAKLVHDEKLPDSSEAYFQYALLYTTPDGHRRIRVHTLSVSTTSNLGTLFKGADLDGFMCVVAHTTAAALPGGTLAGARDSITKACVEPLVAYRKHCASSSSAGQLILPESLKLLPLYCLGLQKSLLFRNDSALDTRACWVNMVASMAVHRLVPVMYPRFIALHKLLDMPSLSEDGSGAITRLPQSLPLSAEKFDPDGAYMCENGMECLIMLGRDAPAELLQQLLGVPSLDMIGDSNALQLPQLDTPLSKAVLQCIALIRQQRGSYMRLRVLKRGDPHESQFFNMLTEDRSGAGMSYVEYLCVVHRQIQNKLS